MLNGISGILTGDILKVLCDMGHGDTVVIVDAHFPGETIAKETTYGKLIRLPGIDAVTVYDAMSKLFPLDVAYTEHPAGVMEMTDGDKAKGMPRPETYGLFEAVMKKEYPNAELGYIERFEFYERAKKSYVVIQTGETRQYGNLILTKGCVL